MTRPVTTHWSPVTTITTHWSPDHKRDPPWEGNFPSLSLPNEKPGRYTMWVGDGVEQKTGVSVSIVWQDDNIFTLAFYTGFSTWYCMAKDLFEVKMICLDHFNKHSPKGGVTSGGNK